MYHAHRLSSADRRADRGFVPRAIGAKARMNRHHRLFLIVCRRFLSWIAFFTVAMGRRRTAWCACRSCAGSTPGVQVDWALRIDTLTAVMLVVVTTCRAWCTSIPSATCTTTRTKPRFFAYLSLFTFAMLMLVTRTTCCRCSSAGKAWASPPTC
jgi:NADH-quinone oxidoreductase subunit L